MFNNSKYIISAVNKSQYPNINNYPEFVFLGRSNVGKSSLINALTNNKTLAKTSSKPGKTQAINFFLIDQNIYFVDVPGYGYASKSLEQRQKFGGYLEQYLEKNDNLRIAFLLIDTQVGPTKDDILMFDYLKYLNLNIKIIGTKCDKVGTTHQLKHQKNIANQLNISLNDIILTSSTNKKGIDLIIKTIVDIL